MRRLCGGLVLILLLTGCGAATVTPGATVGPGSPTAGGQLRKITIGLGYIPDIQFAPFYVAKERGFFREAGLDVTFQQGFETDVLKLLGSGAISFGVAGGDEVLVARSQGVPLVYIATWYQQYPVSVVALEKANIKRVEDLRGRTVGVPGRFGATYTGLLALLDSAGMKVADLQIREVGFNQVQALTQGQVEAVVGYTNNEPVQLRALGTPITTINVFDQVHLATNGLITDEKTQRDDPALVRAVTQAFVRGLQYSLDHPDDAVTLSLPSIPGAAEKRDQVQAVWAATLPLMQGGPADKPIGYCDPAVWTASRDLLQRLGLLGGTVSLEQTYTNNFLPPR